MNWPLSDHELWGFGLRPQHADEVLGWKTQPLLELLVDNYIFQDGGPNREILLRLQGHKRLLLHGIGLDIGGLDPLDLVYLAEVRKLCRETGAPIYSDHLAFTQLDGRPSFDLLPVPMQALKQALVIERVHQVQDFLGMRIALENISAYATYPEDTIPELEFLQGVADATGCGILLDVNNLYVNAHNFGFDPERALRSLDPVSVVQYHVSGHRTKGRLLHDTHDQTVIVAVWNLLQLAIHRLGWNPLILERDDDELSLDEITQELKHGIHSLSRSAEKTFSEDRERSPGICQGHG